MNYLEEIGRLGRIYWIMKKFFFVLFFIVILISNNFKLALSEEIITCKEKEGTTLRSGPDTDFDRIAILPYNAQLPITGEEKDWFKVRASASLELYAPKEDVGKSSNSFTPGLLWMIKACDEKDFTTIEFCLNKPCAYMVNQDLFKNAYVLTLFNTRPGTFEIIYPKDFVVSQYDLRLIATDTVQITMPINSNGLWGYKVDFDNGTLLFKIRKAPDLNTSDAFKNLTVVIDSGHGGGDSGAVGKDGLREKDVNLNTALLLKNKLEEKGFKVVLTRDGDRDVAGLGSSDYDELHSRVVAGEKAMGNVFLSIHYNAMGNVTEGRVAKGTFVYFYHPQSLKFARFIALSLSASINEPNFAGIGRSFHVIRQTQMPSVLIEGAFISNPDCEKKLKTREYLNLIAEGICAGIVNFFTPIKVKTETYKLDI